MAGVVYERVLMRSDCPLFTPGTYARRPTVVTPQPGLVLAGDGIRIDLPVALMERAATTGFSAANHLLESWGSPATSCAPFRPAAARHCCGRWPPAKGGTGNEHRPVAPTVAERLALRLIPRVSWTQQRPTYRDAQPAIINAALDRSQRRATGNWYVFGASSDVAVGRAFGTQVAGVELVAWRDKQRRLRVGPRSCPHLGADLGTGVVRDGVLYCRWHGLAFDGNTCTLGWQQFPATTTACWSGCDSTPPAAKRRWRSR